MHPHMRRCNLLGNQLMLDLVVLVRVLFNKLGAEDGLLYLDCSLLGFAKLRVDFAELWVIYGEGRPAKTASFLRAK